MSNIIFIKLNHDKYKYLIKKINKKDYINFTFIIFQKNLPVSNYF